MDPVGRGRYPPNSERLQFSLLLRCQARDSAVRWVPRGVSRALVTRTAPSPDRPRKPVGKDLHMASPRRIVALWVGLLVVAGVRGAEPALPTLPPPRLVEHPAGPPPWLPNYDLDMNLELDRHQAEVHLRVTWFNRHQRPASEIVLNAHSHYKIPGGLGLLAKTVELLRSIPSESIDGVGHALDVHEHGIHLGDAELPFYYTDPSQVTDEHFAG